MRNNVIGILIAILGAECNNNRLHGYPNSDACLRAVLRGVLKDNPYYWQRTVLQFQVLAALCDVECPIKSGAFWKSDVSLSTKSGGKHSSTHRYWEDVLHSVGEQVGLFQQHPSQVVGVAGGEAFKAFVKLVLPDLIKAGVAPRVVVKVRNASAQGHRGKPEIWKARYEGILNDPSCVGEEAMNRLRAALQQADATECFELTSPSISEPFRLEHVRTVKH
jgi:hypothetical protein